MKLRGLLRRKRFWLCVALVVIFLVIHYSGLQQYFTIETMRYHKNLIEDFIARRYWTSVFIFWCLYVLENVLALPVAAWLTLAAGYFYGTWPAVIYTIISATCGALVLFYLARHFFGNHLQKKYKERLARFNTLFKQYGANYLLMVRFIPLIPFVVVNVFAGLTLVPITTFAWTTAVGMIPVTMIYAFAGEQFQTISSPHDVFSPQIIIVLVILVIISIMPLIIQKIKNGKFI